MDLSLAAGQIAAINFETLKDIYNYTFSRNAMYNFVDQFVINDRILGCLDKTHRQKPPLKYDLDDTHIIFVLCDLTTQNNYHFPYKNEQITPFINVNNKELLGSNIAFQVLSLLPLNFIQSSNDPLTIKGMFYGFPTHIPFNLTALPPPTPAISPPPVLPAPINDIPINLQYFPFYHQMHAFNEFLPFYGNQNLCMNF